MRKTKAITKKELYSQCDTNCSSSVTLYWWQSVASLWTISCCKTSDIRTKTLFRQLNWVNKSLAINNVKLWHNKSNKNWIFLIFFILRQRKNFSTILTSILKMVKLHSLWQWHSCSLSVVTSGNENAILSRQRYSVSTRRSQDTLFCRCKDYKQRWQ